MTLVGVVVSHLSLRFNLDVGLFAVQPLGAQSVIVDPCPRSDHNRGVFLSIVVEYTDNTPSRQW